MSYTSLKGFSNISQKSPSEILEDNIMEFLKWSFIDKGGYFNISRSGVYGNFDNLYSVSDPNYTDGQVWQGQPSWIWESGLSIGEPISISGVYVDGTFYTTGSLPHYYDYPRGRVIFDTAISPTAVVEAEYSFRWIQILNADAVPFLRTKFDSYKDSLGSGELYTVPLPCVAVEVPPKRGVRGYELGSGARYSLNSVSLHVLGETSFDVVRIADILGDQDHKTIHMFDSNEMIASGAFPLDYRGMVQSDAKTYPDWVRINQDGGYRWHKLFIANTNNTNFQKISQGLFISTVQWNTEIILTEV